MDAKPPLEVDDPGSPPRDAVRLLLDQAGLRQGDFVLDALPGGGNNRVFRVDMAGSSPALLKAYFRHPQDPRDRLKAEFDFTRFAWQHGVQRVPRPLASDAAAGLGLYEFIVGRKLEPAEVSDNAVSQALAFCRQLNLLRSRPDAGQLPAGSEACFRLADHVHCVERRLARCESWQPRTDLDRQALAFVRAELLPCWRKMRARVETEAGTLGLALTDVLPEEARCLSPSDFGFHNALLDNAGVIRFIDFEYAGWDDPAKLACDFFCQPALPVPWRFWDAFVQEVVAIAGHPGVDRRRIELLLPVYRVKWVTILLNDFQPAGNERRRFARPGQDVEERKAQQLAKAREGLNWAVG